MKLKLFSANVYFGITRICFEELCNCEDEAQYIRRYVNSHCLVDNKTESFIRVKYLTLFFYYTASFEKEKNLIKWNQLHGDGSISHIDVRIDLFTYFQRNYFQLQLLLSMAFCTSHSPLEFNHRRSDRRNGQYN